MFISCGDDGAAGVESEMGYVPNNPLFGLPLDSPQVKFISITSYTIVDLPKFIKFFDFNQNKKLKLIFN